MKVYLKGIKRKDIDFILNCMHYNKYNFSQKPSDVCYNKQGTIDRMNDIVNRLKEAIK